MNAYDFDKTVFHGDSTQRFLLFLWKRDLRLTVCLPRIGVSFLLCALGVWNRTKCKETVYRCVFPRVRDMDKAVDAFWKANFCRMKAFYLVQKREDDAVISASPEFLLAPVCERLRIPAPIASRVDPKTGAYDGINCHGEEKVRRFRAVYGNAAPEGFWSDSLSDTPMARISQRAYLVKGERVTDWP